MRCQVERRHGRAASSADVALLDPRTDAAPRRSAAPPARPAVFPECSRVLRLSSDDCTGSTRGPDPRCSAAGVSQRIRRPAIHQADAIGALGFVQIRRRHEHRQAVLHQLIENRPEIAARNRIDAIGRLVQKQHARLVQQRAHQRQLLLHAARKLSRRPLRETAPCASSAAAARSALRAPVPGCRTDRSRTPCSRRRQIAVQAEPLRHVADLILHRVQFLRDVVAGHDRRALRSDSSARTAAAWSWSCPRRPDPPGRRSRPPRLRGSDDPPPSASPKLARQILGVRFSAWMMRAHNTISASTGMLFFSSCAVLSTSILIRYTSFTRSSLV